MLQYSIDTINYKNFIISIYVDESSENPREWDNLGKFVMIKATCTPWHLADSTVSDPVDFLRDIFLETACRHIDYDKFEDDFDAEYGIYNNDYDCLYEKYMPKIMEHCVLLPVIYKSYGSSGCLLSVDTNAKDPCGYIYVSHRDLKKENLDAQKGEQILKSEIDIYNDWLNSEVYGYIIEIDEDNPPPDGIECDDSCWGYYGNPNETFNSNLIEDAKTAIDYAYQNFKSEKKAA